MNKIEPRTLSGFMELLPEEQILFDQMKEVIENTYKMHGFLPLDTPVIELSEILLAISICPLRFDCRNINLALFFATWNNSRIKAIFFYRRWTFSCSIRFDGYSYDYWI